MWRGDYATYNVEFVASSNTRVHLVECNGVARQKFSGANILTLSEQQYFV